jgi:predicted phage terminase large subunit-like protein
MNLITPEQYRHLLRSDFTGFVARAFHELNPDTALVNGWYLDLIAATLERCRLGQTKRLVINLPPRSLKTHNASIAFPAWLLGHDPSCKIICASYGQEFSDKPARDTRTLMQGEWYRKLFPRTRIAPNRTAIHDFVTTEGGGRMATSVEGVLMGRGSDVIIIDDPMKPEEAMSETRRGNVNQWFDHSLLSRLNDKAHGCIILIMQRLHQDDLTGHVLEQGGWTHLSLPAIAEADETHTVKRFGQLYTFHRSAGEVLHPERDTLEILEEVRRTAGEYAFQSQYQQNPTPVGGAMVKRQWLRYYEPGDEPSQFEYLFQSWDTGNKPDKLNDPSVCTTWGVKNDLFYLLHVFRERLEYPDLRHSAKRLAAEWHARSIVIEDKASGIQLLQDLKRDGLYGATAYDPNGLDKIMRLFSQTGVFESGRVMLPRTAPWLGEYLAELMTFPGSKHNDQVDSTSQALDWYSNKHYASFFDFP